MLGDPSGNNTLCALAREEVRNRERGRVAPLKAIDAIEAAALLPFEQGITREEALFDECLFNAGIPVLLKEISQEALDRGMSAIRKIYADSVQQGRNTQENVEKRLKLIQPTLSYDGFGEVDIIVEAVSESLDLKRQLFTELERVSRANAILASSTSSPEIDRLARTTSRPDMVLGHHFIAHDTVRLLEIVRGEASAATAIASSMALAKKLGKIGVLVGNCRDFVGSRMYLAYQGEAQFLVREGARVQDVDAALYNFGMARGSLAAVGLPGNSARTISAMEIVDRTVYALINEGARILGEGMALRASDIDIICVHGYGFPAQRGGPMWFPDTVGVANIYARVREFERIHGAHWTPAPLLERLAANGKTFADYDANRT
jgi:3-hydroxyacyl-CoA dehydrogenase